jgi:hypothetical protein
MKKSPVPYSIGTESEPILNFKVDESVADTTEIDE